MKVKKGLLVGATLAALFLTISKRVIANRKMSVQTNYTTSTRDAARLKARCWHSDTGSSEVTHTSQQQRTVWIMNHYATHMMFDKGGRHYLIAKELKTRNYNTVIFCCNTTHGNIRYFEDNSLYTIHESSIDVPFVVVDSTVYEGNGAKRVKSMIVFARNLVKAGRDYAQRYGFPDIILASSVHPLTVLAGEKLARDLGVPCICEVRDLWPEAFFYAGILKEKSLIGKSLTACEHWMYDHADALVFLKPGDSNYIREHGWDIGNGGKIDLSRCFYINNGVDLQMFDACVNSEITHDADFESDKKLFIYTGSINRTNEVGNLIDAAELLRFRNDIKILVYGTGADFDILNNRVIQSGLDNIEFKGRVDKAKIPYILSNARASILNYSSKGYNWSRGNSSNKLFEYMAAGKPVISTVKMAYSPIEENRCGITIDKPDAKHLAKAIETICDMPVVEYEQMCANARKGAEEYDYSILTDKLEEVIRIAIDGELND